jgi:LCP family protein required for cell wall assembly
VKKRSIAAAAAVLCSLAGLRFAAWLYAAPAQDPALVQPAKPQSALALTVKAPPLAPSVPRAAPSSAPPRVQRVKTPALENTDNYLLLGIDRRADGKGAMLADTIIVLVLDRVSGHVGLVSVPRDAYVDIGDGNFARINTVLQAARRSGKDPLEQGKRVVGDTLALPIRHALTLDLGVFERAVDELGGVTLNVPCPIRDRFVDTREPTGHRWLDLDAGEVRLDGATAALYVRSRHGRSDFSRARRQQAVLLALRAELESAGGLSRLPALWEVFEHSVHTDLRRYQLFDLARRVLAAGPERLHGLVLNHPHVRPLRTEDGSSVLEVDGEAVAEALGKLFSTGLPGAPAGPCPPKDVALSSEKAAKPPATPEAS